MKKIITLLCTLLGLGAHTACCQSAAYETVGVKKFAKLIQDTDVQLVDVRTAEEFAEGHIARATNIDVEQSNFLQQAQQQLDASRPVAVYCKSGRRASKAADMLAQEGMKVTNLQGGILAWKLKRKPVTQEVTTNASTPTLQHGKEVDTFLTPNGHKVQIHALLHASLRIVFDGKEIEIDPVRQLGDRKTDYSVYPQADVIFVTHEHGDHFDQEAINQLSSEKTRLITNQRCADMAGHGEVLHNGDKQSLADYLHVEAVPAYNTTEGRQQFHPKGRDNGYILTIDGLRIYIAGDTEDIPEMKDIHNIDIAFIPCDQPYTMTTDQLERAARVIRPRILFPYHFGQTDVTLLPQRLKGEGIDVRIRHYE